MNKLIDQYLSTKFIRFVIVGLISAAIEYSLYFLLTYVVGYQIANVVSFGLTNIVTFLLSRKYVFASNNENKLEEASLFIVCLLGALFVSQLVLWSLVEFYHIDDKIAKAFAIGVAVIWNYFTRKHIVFKNKLSESADTPEPAAAVTEPVKDSEDDIL